MNFLEVYLICAAGVALSIVSGPLGIYVRTKFKPAPQSMAGEPSGFFKQHVLPFLALGLFSLLTSLLIVAAMQNTLQDWRAALLAGYAWDSTLQKLR
jgi:hypothetical protein